MLDTALRPFTERLLAPATRSPIGRLHPTLLTLVSLTTAVGAGLAAWQRGWAVAVVLWLVSRLADGLDGVVARRRGRTSDLGGLLDIVGDTVGYAIIPIGVAAGLDTRTGWVAVAVLLATFYVNAVSWTYLSAVLEKRAAGARAVGASTSVVMPRGVVEGAETFVFFTIALAVPSAAPTVFWVMAAAVVVTVVERLWWARRILR